MRRRFARFPAAVVVVMINGAEQILMLESSGIPAAGDRRPRGTLEVPSGAIEAGETILDAVSREIAEELGTAIRWRPLGTVHAYTIRYDVDRLISVIYLVEYKGGEIVPGDDAAGATARWMRWDEIDQDNVAVPSQPWLLGRGVELYRAWRSGTDRALQPELD